MNYGDATGNQASYGQQSSNYSGMQPNAGYYPNNQQQMMPNPRKCSTIVSPDQLQQQQMLNQRKCSTVMAPNPMQQMMPPPTSQIGLRSSGRFDEMQQTRERRFSQQHNSQIPNIMPPTTSQIGAPQQQMMQSAPQISPNFMPTTQPQQTMQVSPNQMGASGQLQVSPNQQQQSSPVPPYHKLSLQHQHSLNQQHMQMNPSQQMPPQNMMPMTQPNMIPNNQHSGPLAMCQDGNMPAQQVQSYNNSIDQMGHQMPPVQHKFSLQHQRSIPSVHLSPNQTNMQVSPNQQQIVSQNQHMPLQHQHSLTQPNNYSQRQNNYQQQPSANLTNASSYSSLRDCTPPPQLHKMDAQFSNNAPFVDTSSSQQQNSGFNHSPQVNGRQSYNPMQQMSNGQQQIPPNTNTNNYTMQRSTNACNPNPTASDDFYARQQSSSFYYQQQQPPWRKASLACNFRLNPTTRKDSSISPNFPPSSHEYPSQHGFGNNQTQMNATETSRPKEQSSFGAHHRSQSLSAAEFLKRHGPPNSLTEKGPQQGAPLRRFSSQLRTHKPSNAGLMGKQSLANLMLYTPPPMLSPMRSGSGLYRSISRQERKISSLALSLKRMDEEPNTSTSAQNATESGAHTTTPVNPPSRKTSAVVAQQQINGKEQKKSKTGSGMLMFSDPLELEQARASLTGRKPFIRPPMDNRANAPQRKNGLFLSEAGQGSDGSAFAAELEALRKESASSTQSNQEGIPRRMSIVRNSKLSLTVPPNHEEVLRKLSSTSIDEKTRKLSSTSDTYYDYVGLDSDITPHINLGKAFQARVKKWSPREISDEEREAIPDRDDIVFDNRVIDHIPQRAVAAYEALACSQAVPRPGRNKELALHILMENQGNLQAAVMDLLRSDTLDWEQYPIIYNNLYLDVDDWSPEEICSFQDAIYKSEKDFHQVASELGNRTVKQCVAFYYTWKKCCPDDYRKLRNLRRKRLLLEQQIDYSTLATDRQRLQSENQVTSEDESDGLESDAASVASNLFNRPYSPYEDTRGEKHPRFESPLEQLKASVSQQQFGQQPHFGDMNHLKQNDDHSNQVNPGATGASASNFPWLHGEFPSPGSSNANSSYSQPPSVGSLAMDLFNADSSGMPSMHQKTHRPSSNKKGAQPSADGFFHCRLCEKRFEKVKSLNAHMKSHAMKARAEAEAQQQLQNKQNQQKQMHLPQQSPLSMALGAAVRLQQQQGNFGAHRPHEDPTNDDRSPNESLSPLSFLSPAAIQQQQNQQQQQAFLRLFGGNNPFQAAQQLAASAANDAAVSQAMSQLTAAQFSAAFGQQPPDLQNVLAQMPTTQAANQNAAAALEQLHLQQNHLQHSATIMH